MKANQDLSFLLSVHGAVFLFGAAGLFGKLLDLPPTLIVSGRVVFAAAVLGGVVLARTRPPSSPPRRHFGDRVVIAAMGLLLAIHWVTFFHAIQVSSVAVGLLTFATFPVFAALLEPLVPGERFDRAALGAALATIAGIALVVSTRDPGEAVVHGAFWGVVSGFTFALLSLANRVQVRRRSAIALALQQDAWAALFLLPFALGAPRLPTVREWVLLVVLGVVFTAAAHALFIHGLRGVSAARAAVITALEPVYGLGLAVVVLGERPGPRTLLGGVIVVAAAAWTSRRPPCPIHHAGSGAPRQVLGESCIALRRVVQNERHPGATGDPSANVEAPADA